MPSTTRVLSSNRAVVYRSTCIMSTVLAERSIGLGLISLFNFFCRHFYCRWRRWGCEGPIKVNFLQHLSFYSHEVSHPVACPAIRETTTQYHGLGEKTTANRTFVPYPTRRNIFQYQPFSSRPSRVGKDGKFSNLSSCVLYDLMWFYSECRTLTTFIIFHRALDQPIGNSRWRNLEKSRHWHWVLVDE